MTIFTKPSLIFKKPPLIHDSNCEEVMIDVRQSAPACAPRKRSTGALVLLSVTALLVAAAGAACGVVLYRQCLRTNGLPRYQGFCTIPIATKQVDPQLIEELNYRKMPLRWSTDPEVQVFDLLEEQSGPETTGVLREELDIGDNEEKIVVIDNDRRVNFIHDFDSNSTVIVDVGRCFTMELDGALVLAPRALAAALRRGERFDVSRVRSQLRALLPALPALQRLADTAHLFLDDCLDKPLYRLRKDEGLIIRKRSADAPPHDYMQFSGKHVQEIEITNLAELLQEEQAARDRVSA